MKVLEIQTLLRLHGLEHVKEYLKLDVKEKDNLVLLKYRQLDADWTKKPLLDCRGIILDRTNAMWEVVAFPYEKFFNIGEGYCADIDWETAKFYEKADGSLVNLYFYNDEWHVQTSGTIDAYAQTNHVTMLFRDLFWYTVEEVYGDKNEFVSRLDTSYNYMFELCTPWNIVVTPHENYTLKLHGVRDMSTFKYVDIESTGLVCVKQYDLKSVDEMLSSFDDMSWMEEGFVVCDANFNRAKCKNPKYVAVHHVSTGVSPYAIVNVIKTNEVDEYLAYFKHKTDEINFIKENWDKELEFIQSVYDSVKDIEDQKEFALSVFSKIEKTFTGIMFGLRSKSIESVHEGMCKLENRFWYNRFLKANGKDKY